MRATVLGDLTLTSGGDPVAVPEGKVGKLLCTFLVSPDDVRPAGDLCEVLWPGADGGASRRRLYVAVSRLRRFLELHADAAGSLRLERQPGGYRLLATPESLDRSAFETLAQRALADGDVDALEGALALWGGEPYSGFMLSAEVRNQRARLTQLHRELVEAKMRRVDSAGRATGFLRSKFRAPRPHRETVLARPRLLDTTPDVGATTALTVTAPAGFGKSVFLSEWAQRQPVPVAWVCLDEEDNDAARFWSGVVGAIVESGRSDLQLATAELRAGSAAFLDTVCEVIDSAGSRFALVLDDVHEVTNPAIADQLWTWLSALPPPATIAVASRAEVPFPTAKLEVSGRLHRVTAVDLRFTIDEIEALVGDRDGAERLWERTEGWPVAVTALRGMGAPPKPGSPDGEMARYVLEEVLGAVPVDVQRFLMEVAFLERFSRQLCDAATGRGDAAEMMQWLQHHQFFLLEQGHGGSWFRLHHLVADELRRRGDADPQVDPLAVQQRAARWFAGEQMPEQALRLAIDGRDRHLIVATAPEVLVAAALRQEARAAVRWLELLNPDDLSVDQRAHSIATCLAAIWAPVELRLRWALSRRRSFGGDDDVVLRFHDGVVDAKEGRTTDAVERLERVIADADGFGAEIAPDLSPAFAAMAKANLVEARMFQDTLHPDDELMQDAIGEARPTSPGAANFALSYWSLVAFADGSYYLASSLAEQYFQTRQKDDIIRRPTPGNSLPGALAQAQRGGDRTDLGRLADGIADLIDLYDRLGSYTWVALTRLVMAALHRAAGDLGAASLHQIRADALLRTLPDVPFLVRFAACVDDVVAGRSPRAQGPAGVLTDRERVVLAYLTTDLTIGQIAEALYVSRGTVSTQISSIYRKLGVNSRHRALLTVGIENIDLSVLAEPDDAE